MYGKKSNPPQTVDITQKTVKTWYGGTKKIPTSRAEQKKMKAELKRTQPHVNVVDSATKKRMEKERDADWIEKMCLLNMILDD